MNIFCRNQIENSSILNLCFKFLAFELFIQNVSRNFSFLFPTMQQQQQQQRSKDLLLCFYTEEEIQLRKKNKMKNWDSIHPFPRQEVQLKRYSRLVVLNLFGLQVPVDDKFSVYCTGSAKILGIVPEIYYSSQKF